VLSETLRLRDRGIRAYPFLQPDRYVDSTKSTLHIDDSTTVIPVSGIPDEMTVQCSEGGTTVTYRADSLGFRNPENVWDPIHSTAALIGDSFAHGFCRPESETIGGNLRAKGVQVINAGITGAGPLAELGVLREFIAPLKPNIVFWLFYEGNDLIDISSERQTALAKYLEPGFSQHLSANKAQIAAAEKKFADSLIAAHPLPGFGQRLTGWLVLRELRTATGLYKHPKVPHENVNEELPVFARVLQTAQNEVSAWNGRLVVVYLPERRRFNTKTHMVAGENHDPRLIEREVRALCAKNGIPFLDVAREFEATGHPSGLWNARRYHYNAEGYAIVARAILAWMAANRV
jgi:lysophospholipase L1-like esterase